jgi:hypothetical protein
MLTRAIRLHSRFRRQYPQEPEREIWDRVCGILIPGYDTLPQSLQRDERELLQLRVTWRLRKRRPRKTPS